LTYEAPSSWSARIETWKKIMPEILSKPLIGGGKGSVDLGRADNEYILQVAEGGIIGLILFLFIVGRILRKSYRLAKGLRDPWLKGFAMGAFTGTFALLVHAIAATTFTVVRTTVVFYFVAGILYAIDNIHSKEQKEKDLFSSGYLKLRPKSKQAQLAAKTLNS
ncbi:O-antigen ligase family protein, partial [Planctomycetota bacterium]